MKKKICYLAGVASLLSATAFAHPKNSDSTSAVPVGSLVTLNQDLNILPNSNSIVLGEPEDRDPFCVLYYVASPKDRVIPAGTVFTVKNVYYHDTFIFDGHPTDISSIDLQSAGTQGSLTIRCVDLATIQTLRTGLGIVGASLSIASPVAF